MTERRMTRMSRKRTLDHFFRAPAVKVARVVATPAKLRVALTDLKSEPINSTVESAVSISPSQHSTYPFPIAQLPCDIVKHLEHHIPSIDDGKHINDQPDLDLVYFHPYIPREVESDFFNFLRERLFFYRVKYVKMFGPREMQINTPRYTTVFGVDETSYFSTQIEVKNGNGDCVDVKENIKNSNKILLDKKTHQPVPSDRYSCRPRPIPDCLLFLKELTEASTNETYNFCLVNYYADGNDSISYHSDDERFLGPNPAIASFSFGAKRDFCMKHKPDKKTRKQESPVKTLRDKPLKMALDSGDMVLMRGSTQAKWLHSIPKRKGGESGMGRINITFRKAMVTGGTENYYKYNVGEGGAFQWNRKVKEMLPWKP